MKFLFPVHALSRVFRGKFLDALTQAFTQGEVRLPDGKTEPKAVESFIDGCKQQDWVVYAKSSFKNPEAVLDYLSRYTRKTAIGNERLVDEQDGQVRFRYRDYAHGNTTKVLGLEPEECIRRFLLHILPKRFVRIRGYGLLANRDRRKHLQKARAALGQFEEMPSAPQVESVEAFMLRVAGIDIRLCPRCGKGRMCEVAILPPTRGPPAIGLPSTGSER